MRFMVSSLVVVVGALGCRSLDYPNSSSITDQAMPSGIQLKIWTQVAWPEEMANTQREVVFNHHLDAVLEEISHATSEHDLVVSRAKMQDLLKTMALARPEPRPWVSAPVENQLDLELDCHVYRYGASSEEAIIPVPAGGSKNIKLQEGVRYQLVWTKAGTGQVVGEYIYRRPAYEGIPAVIRYKKMY